MKFLKFFLFLSLFFATHWVYSQANAPKYVVAANEQIRSQLYDWIKEKQIFSNNHFAIRSTIEKKNQWVNQSGDLSKMGSQNFIVQHFNQLFADLLGTYENPQKKALTLDNILIEITFIEQPQRINQKNFGLNIRAYIYKKFIAIGYQPSLIEVEFFPLSIGNNLTENSIFDYRDTLMQWIVLIFILLAGGLFYYYWNKKPSFKQFFQSENLKDILKQKKSDNVKLNISENNQIILKKFSVNTLRNRIKKTLNNKFNKKSADKNNIEIQSIIKNQDIIKDKQTDSKGPLNNSINLLYQKLVNQLNIATVKHPYFLKRMYGIWQNQEIKDLDIPYLGNKMVVIYAIYGKEVMQHSLPQLQEDDYIHLAYQLQIIKKHPEDWGTNLQNVLLNVEKLLAEFESKDPYQNPFGFIKAMPDEAIIALLKDKAFHIQTITLSQFDFARCQSLLLKMHINENIEKYNNEIEHYRKFNAFFFQDVANFLAYVMTQHIFKDTTVPLDEVMSNNPQAAQSETIRALGDMNRQMNLGLISEPQVPQNKTTQNKTNQNITAPIQKSVQESLKNTVNVQSEKIKISKTTPTQNLADIQSLQTDKSDSILKSKDLDENNEWFKFDKSQ